MSYGDLNSSSTAFAAALESLGVRKGDRVALVLPTCPEFVESFFGVLKRERVNRRHYRTRAEARADIFDYIERCHNPRQRRRLELQQQGEQLLTQPSVEMG